MVKLTGILPAVPTPFSADGERVDVDNIKKQVDRLVEAGVHGIVSTGTTGEFTTLDDDEYRSVVKAYIDAAAGRIPIVAGFGCLTTKGAIKTADWAKKAGAAACMVVPPFYDPLPFEAVKKFFSDLTTAVDIPIMYYNLPGATGVNLTADQIRDLGSVKGLDYLKDTSGNAKEQVDMLTQAPNLGGITLLNGWDTLTFSAMALGATAGVWGAASVVPKEAVELWDTLAVQADLAAARQQWQFLWQVSDFLESVNYAAGIKAGLEIVGSPAGPVRAPNVALTSEQYEQFEKILAGRKYK